MTQRDDGHDYRDSKNKAEAHSRKKFDVSLAGLNNQINRLIKLTPTNEQIRLDMEGKESLQIAVNPKYLQEQLSTITDDLTDILVDLKIQTGVDV
jgi:hypothetical protein|tara:strand:+ start:205 stop:489 length:285 start_codon:yes stop_codon:yes gene_type:complete